MAEKKKSVKSWKEKKWFEVYAPPMFGGQKMGTVPADDPSKLIGRVFETTLGDLLQDYSKSHIKIYFQVTNVDGEKAKTSFIGHEIARDYLRAQIRRRTRKIDEITTVRTKDGNILRITSMAITLGKQQTSKVRAVRKAIAKVVNEKASERTLDQLVQEIVLGKVSADIHKEAKKFCPIKKVEVCKSKLLGHPQPPVQPSSGGAS
ncbi:MAG: 30S ribosomal protein S3ae [Candidatus Hadarchaeales archaeon]